MAQDSMDFSAYDLRANVPSFIKNIHRKPYPAIDPKQPSLSAAGKTVVITGGATGIGFSIARNFAAADASTIVLLARRASSLEEAAAVVSKTNPNAQVLTYPTDISDYASVDKTLKSIVEDAKNHTIDILVTSAVYPPAQHPVLKASDSYLRGTFETNIFGNLNLIRSVLDLSTPSPSSSPKIILDVSSEAAFNSFVPGTSIYGASKYCLTFLLKYLQSENPDTVRIHSFHPGGIWTPAMQAAGIKWEDIEAVLDDEELPGRFAVWLASDAAEFLKGRFVFSKWDVEELVQNREEFKKDMTLANPGLKL